MKNTTATPTLEKIWEGNVLYGRWNRVISVNNPTATAPSNTSSGGIAVSRITSVTVPSVTSPVTGFTIGASITSTAQFAAVVGLEYVLGTLTVSGNSFSAGVTMPTKTVRGASIQTAADVAFLYISTALGGATTPTVTLTYTNQDGTGGRTATLVLPTNPIIGSCFYIPPHFQSGDSGIYSLSNASISTGTSGVIKVLGILTTNKVVTASAGNSFSTNFMSSLEVPYLAAAGEIIGFYRFGATVGAAENIIHIVGIPEA